jgi:SNF2 family DNA or RNA helicase
LWEHLRHLKVQVCTGTEKARLSALQSQADIYVINRENVPWLVAQYGKRWPFDCVVIDEASSFKNASSQRFKALRKTLPDTEYMILLTGTPSPNGLLDLWPQIYLIDFGNTLGRTMTAYKQRFFEQDYMGYKFTPRAGSAEKIHALLRPHVLSMSAADYLQLPDRIDLIERVTLPAAALQAYRDFEKTLLAELPDGEEVEAISAAVLANKLLQFSNGAMYTDDLGNWSEIHDAKLEALADLIEQNPNENILLAYNYKTDLVRLQKRFPQARVLDKNPDTVRAWNDGEIELLLAHPASAGHGLNLQRGGSLIIWFGLNWSLELYQQFNARLHRQGQDKPVRVVHLIADNCIDERVMSVLSDKTAMQSALLQALKPR